MKKKQGRGFKWTREEEDKLKELYDITKMKDLAIYFGRSKTAVGRKALKIGLKRNQTMRDYKRIWVEKEEEYLKQNYAFGNIDKIAEYLKRTKKAVTERTKLLNLRRDKETTRKQRMKYEVDEHFFRKWSYDMVYTLGLICSDGNLSKSSNAISICLHRDDAYLFDDILRSMGSTHKVYFARNKKMASICINNYHLYGDLLKLGLTPNKSKTLKCPNVPVNFIPSFILGVLDGDGSVDTKNKRIKIASASQDFINGLSGMLEKIEIEHRIYNEPYTHNGVKTDFYTIRVLRRSDVKKIYTIMYKDIGLYLKRKKEAFEKMGILGKDFDDLYSCNRKAIIGTNSNTGKIIEFGSIKDAIDSGVCNKRVHQALNNRSSHKGYTWEYKEKHNA